MSQRLSLLAGLAAVSLLALVRPTYAADLDYGYGDAPPPVSEEKVEFGSGWYVRGDIGATQLPALDPTTPTLGAAPDIQLTKSSHLGYNATIGAGYQFTPWFRADMVFDFHEPLKTNFSKDGVACVEGWTQTSPASSTTTTTASGSTTTTTTPAAYSKIYGNCTGQYSATVKGYDTLINGYIDLGTWHNISPYIGAGVGLSFGHYSTAANYIQPDGTSYNVSILDPNNNVTYHYYYDKTNSGNYYNLAFALMAGVSVDVFDHTKLDLSYRYLHLGSVLNAQLTNQEVRAGLRYMIDN